MIAFVMIMLVSSMTYAQDLAKLKAFDFDAHRVDETMTLEGVEREFIVYVPSRYDNTVPTPVVFMFHGTSGTGEKFWNISRWKELAEKETFIAVFPTALKHRYYDEGVIKNKTKWNDGKLETIAVDPTTLKDDVNFVREIVDYLKTNYNINDSQIFGSGFSNGGNFVSRLAVDAPDIFSAVAASSGSLQIEGATPSTLIPYYLSVGGAEFEENTGEPVPADPADLVAHPFLAERLAGIKTTFELGDTYVSRVRPNHISLKFSENLGSGDNYFIFSIVKGLEHRYPNGTNNPAGYIAATHYWEFFQNAVK